jgi:hypothetical protein
MVKLEYIGSLFFVKIIIRELSFTNIPNSLATSASLIRKHIEKRPGRYRLRATFDFTLSRQYSGSTRRLPNG